MPKKLERCIEKVSKKSSKLNPYAICNASINKSKHKK